MMRSLCVFALTLAMLALLGLVACGEGTVDEQVSDTVNDTRTLRDAQTAANALVRNGSDCDAVKAAYPDVKAKLDAAERQAQTAVGRNSIETLRRQVAPYVEACGVR